MSSRRTSAAAAVVLVVTAVLAPLLGVAVALAARPNITAEPTRTTSALVEPMPAAPAAQANPAAASLFESLPIVEAGPGGAPRPFVEQYRTTPAGDALAGSRLIQTAIDEIRVDPAGRRATADFLAALTVEAEAGSDEPIDDGEEDPTAAVGTFDTDAFRSLAATAMERIAEDRANAVALNDVAVATFAASLTDSSDALGGEGKIGGRPLAAAFQLREAAPTLLELGLRAFPGDRAMTINLALLHIVAAGGTTDAAVDRLERYVATAPRDATARSLLAQHRVASDPAGGLDRAFALAQPLVDSPETEAAGRLVLADALVQAADARVESSPFVARSLLLRGIAEYDRVIGRTGDAAAFAGRATALDLLKERTDAIRAQAEAVARNPASIPWRLHLAQLRACEGKPEGSEEADASLRLALGAKAPTLADARLVAEAETGRGPRGYSIGSDRLALRLTSLLPPTGTVVVVTLDPFPAPVRCLAPLVEPGETVARTGEAAWLAAVGAGDIAAAHQVIDTWLAGVPSIDESEEAVEPTDLRTVLEVIEGTRPAFDPESDQLLTFLELARSLPADAERRTCEALSRVPDLDAESADLIAGCIAESAHRQGDDAAALQAIERLVHLDDADVPTDGLRALQAGVLNERAGRLDLARKRYEVAATADDTGIAGLMRLGDLDLLEGDASGAIDHYALAIASVRAQLSDEEDGDAESPSAASVRQYLDNNRGIALLMTARTDPETPPDCAANPAICSEARAAFEAALGADPENPLYEMNSAWVARLSGDTDGAARRLEKALAIGTPLVAPAENDLGVLAARRGDLAAARSHFARAIGAEPGYDLAAWNLGVLDSRQAGGFLLAGQAMLADASRINEALRTGEIAFRTDERVYRVEVSGTEVELARAPGTGAAIGAAAFGAVATVGAVGQLLSGLGGSVEDAGGTIAQESLGRRRRWPWSGRGRRLPSRVGGAAASSRSWFAWIPAIVVLAITTAWTAAWVAPDAVITAVAIGLVAAGLALVVHASGHLVAAGLLGASLRPSRWDPGLALALVGMPFHVPAGPFLAERIESADPRRAWWVSVAGALANLAAAGFAMLLFLAAPMPFLRVLGATHLAVAAFSLIPSEPLDGSRLAMRPIVLALIGLGVAAASTAIAVGAI